MTDTVVKRGAPGPVAFAYEAAGLAWLRAARGAATVEVLDVEPDAITVRRVVEVRPTANAARAFGAALAVTHDAGASAFGAPPSGWGGPMYIGRRVLPPGPDATWGAFYAERRVRPFLAPAVAAGGLTASDRDLVERACDLVASGAFDDGDPAARIHGDLWTGNVLWSVGGAVLIDPAAHGGHRETDLAMLALFGAPQLDAILDGYESAHPLAPDRRERVPLHPLAVHAVGHGPAYGSALVAAARAVMALA